LNFAVLLSGGTGSRIRSEVPKQYVKCGGHMMITHALKTLAGNKNIDCIFIVADESRHDDIRKDASSADLPVTKLAGFALPGANRQLSILNGMESIKGFLNKKNNSIGKSDTVLVHDAARPFLSSELINGCYETLSGHDGVMPVLSMKDTVYLCSEGSQGRSISGLLDRQRVIAGQAPELFLFEPYYEANRRLLPDEILKINGASEPAVMAGMDIAVTEGDELNFKVTTDADLKRFFERVKEKMD